MRTNQGDERIVDSFRRERSALSTPRDRGTSIVITGFMGTGKTSVGRLLADSLGRAFIDMDATIESREDKTVQELFAARGESYFREREKELCKELAKRRDLVIATGGGTLVDPENRVCFRNAFVVCLDATIDTLVGRLKNTSGRPLLQGDVRGRVNNMLSARRSAYQEIDMHVDTTGKTVEEVAAEIIAMFRAEQDGAGHGAD